VTDSSTAGSADWLPGLRDLARRSAHETRNALNGLVVNLEVVRSRLARSGGDDTILPFAGQAAAQAEESVKLSEAAGALMTLITGAIDTDGRLRCARTAAASPELRFEVDSGTAERVLPGLQTLGRAVGFGAETHGGAVILSFPEASSAEFRKHE